MQPPVEFQELTEEQHHALLNQLQAWAEQLGFSQIGVSDLNLDAAHEGLQSWLASGFHGSMNYMHAHGSKRTRPAELVPGTVRVITARMNYLASNTQSNWPDVEWKRIADPQAATISVYARGRDYHKVLRARLQKLADRLAAEVGPFGHRVFTDSAPVMEVALATKSGIAWRGKHTLGLHREAGSMFFLGEIYIDLPLPLTPVIDAHCGTCSACITVCPTQAIVAPYVLDARRCISYLTIEHAGPIPVELRALMGNRIYGCDDCQLVCPWNKYAALSPLPDFDARAAVTDVSLLELWRWDEAEFMRRTEGSAIRRIGFERWRRNLAVALGNALRARRTEPSNENAAIKAALIEAADASTALVAEHIAWALETDEA
jgi:epoxyqueuosine reductase